MSDVPGQQRPRGLTLCTAGHIDHGKSALVAALTGKDTDRLAEERRRGISIELGFAELELAGGRRLSLVDVPGHEALVRTMVAGAGGVDLYLLVVAADDGPMPQTLEHLSVLRALGIEVGVVALTKIDLVGRAGREAAAAAVGELVPGAPVVGVSSLTGEGLPELDARIEQVAAGMEIALEPAADAEPILHVDRVFSLAGAGTVATGTLAEAPLGRGAELTVLPAGFPLRVRSLQVHDRDVDPAPPGRRVAVAVTGSRRGELKRGDVLARRATKIRGSYRLDVELDHGLAASAFDGERFQVHHGTRESPARLVALGAARLAQLRLESELVARPYDRVVLRRIAPSGTLGGARVLDPSPRRHGPSEALARRLRLIAQGEPTEPIDAAPAASAAPVARANPARPVELGRLDRIVLALIERGGGEPPSPGAIAERLGVEARAVGGSVGALAARGLVVRMGREVVIVPAELDRLRSEALGCAGDSGSLTLAAVRDRLGTSRKYAQALLEHLDATRVTIRRGDRHVLRAPPAESAPPSGVAASTTHEPRNEGRGR